MTDETNHDARTTNETIYVSEKDLPLCCPLPNKPLWSAHPRVYLPLKGPGEILCPYCSAKYIYKEE